WASPYAALRSTNVSGTKEILRLAAHGRRKPIHYVSSVVVLFSMRRPHEDTTELREEDRIGADEGIALGYPQTKWVAEEIVRLAGARGLPVAIYRPGLITGASGTGIGNPEDFLGRMIKGCIQLGGVPVGVEGAGAGIVPVDYASRAIVHLAESG